MIMKNLWEEQCTGFKDYLQVQNYSKSSLRGYLGQLKNLFDYLQDQGITDLRRVGRHHLKAYAIFLGQQKLKGQPYALSTIGAKIRPVKRFFEYLETTGYLLINPAQFLQEPRARDYSIRDVLTEEEATKLLEQPDLNSLMGVRNRAILELFYSTGIRLNELLNLTIYDCDLKEKLLRINLGKCSKDRMVPLGNHAIQAIRRYLTEARPYFCWENREQTRLFVGQTGKPLSGQTIEIMVRAYAKKAGINRRVTPHLLRHTFATLLVQNGSDLQAVQKMMGHTTLKITQHYVKVLGYEVKKSHTDHHPTEQEKTSEAETPQMERLKGYYGHE